MIKRDNRCRGGHKDDNKAARVLATGWGGGAVPDMSRLHSDGAGGGAHLRRDEPRDRLVWQHT
jgi:hypothetical protein